MKEALSQKQEMKQLQRLTPMQVQFVRMLEMTGAEVEAEVQRALEEMPALDTDDSVHETAPADDFDESAEQVQMADYRADDMPTYFYDSRNRSTDDEHYEPVAVNDEPTLAEDLRHQISELTLPSSIAMIADYIIGNLDTNGYLKRDIRAIADDIAMQQMVEVSEAQVKEALEVVRSLDPAGVAAMDLRECLLLQLDRRESPTPDEKLAKAIVEHHFDTFSKHHFDALASRLGVDSDTLARAVEIITKLNPKPGSQSGDTAIERSARLIVPEFLVEADGDELTVSLLNNIPQLVISATFAEDTPLPASPTRQQTDAHTFIRTRREEASAFIRTLQMRQSTLFNVMSAIVKLQREFFLTGDETKLKPMILKDVAALTGYDLSVISRATASRYVTTASGTYPLKFFFNERPNAEHDATIHQIADALRSIIDNEDKHAPLSDEQITSKLEELGFKPARRTVSKYRERMGYPVARLRRKL